MKKITIIVLMLVTIMTVTTNQAEANTVYEVKSGDTLAEISERLGVSVDNIIDQNNISNPSNIYAGQKLIIIIEVRPEEPQERYGYYTIQQGDILWNIAQKYNTTVERLVELNNIKDSYDLYAGRKILVPLNNNGTIDQEDDNIYIVQEGDLIWTIAQKFNTTVEKLVELNDITSSYDLYVGKRLIIPSPEDDYDDNNNEIEDDFYYYPLYSTYQVKEGDQIREIATKFGVSTWNIIEVNNIASIEEELQTGRELIIPLEESNRFSYIKRTSRLLDNYYRVNSGESVASIANKFDISEATLRGINNLDSNEELSYGQKLLMPVSSAFFTKHKVYRVQKSEEYIADIAYNHSVTVRSIVQSNYLKNLNVKLKKGDTIILSLDDSSKTDWIESNYN